MGATVGSAATTMSSTVRPLKRGSFASLWFSRLMLPLPHAAKEWRLWGRPLRSGLWPFWVALGLLWAAPLGTLVLGEGLSLDPRSAEGLMWGIVSYLVLCISVYFVDTWWRRPSTRSVMLEMLATPSSPYDYSRSVMRPLQVLLFAACLPPLALKPGSDLLGWFTGRGFLRGEWMTLGFAANVLLCAILDTPLILWAAAHFRDPFRTICAIWLSVVPCHLPTLFKFAEALGFSFAGQSGSGLLGPVLLLQVALAIGAFFHLPRCVNSCAQGYVEGKR